MAKSHLQLVVPANEKPTVASNNPAGRKKNDQYRDREHLQPSEVERLIEAARGNRNGQRDATMIRLAAADDRGRPDDRRTARVAGSYARRWPP
jgi:integrase